MSGSASAAAGRLSGDPVRGCVDVRNVSLVASALPGGWRPLYRRGVSRSLGPLAAPLHNRTHEIRLRDAALDALQRLPRPPSASSSTLHVEPAAVSPMPPPLAITRWQGSTIGIGFAPFA